MTGLILGTVPAIVAALLGRSLLGLRIPRLTAANHRGTRLPVVLGIAMSTAVVASILGVLLFIAISGQWSTPAGKLAWVAIAVVGVAGAGFLDDLASGGPRGLRGHLGSLRFGRMSTGMLKVLVIVTAGAGVSAVTLSERGPLAVVLGTILAAATANVWNGLDVAPGRSGKFFLLAALPTLLANYRNPAWLTLVFCSGALIGVLAFDLRERGMLGDTGANVLGFVLGAAIAPSLSTVGLAAAVGVAIALNIVAELVTFSRIISAVPPLRWFDRLGRLPSGPRFSPN